MNGAIPAEKLVDDATMERLRKESYITKPTNNTWVTQPSVSRYIDDDIDWIVDNLVSVQEFLSSGHFIMRKKKSKKKKKKS